MGLTTDFEVLWDQEKKQIYSAILLQEKKKEGISVTELQQAYRIIIGKWSNALSAEYGFMKHMRQIDPSLADDFQARIKGFSFSEIPKPAMPSLLPYIVMELVVCLAGAGSGYLLASKSIIGRYINGKIVILIGAVTLGTLTAGIVRDIWQNKKQEAWHKIGDGYRAQIEALEKELRKLCSK